MILGGLTLGEPLEDAKSIYGEPDRFSIPGLSWCDGYYQWGTSFEVAVDKNKDDPSQYHLAGIFTMADNGIETAMGIHVGSSYDDVIGAYGEPDSSSFGRGGYGWIRYQGTADARKTGLLIFRLQDNTVTAISLQYPTGE